ncbi:MAG: type II toxin-antitoxin system VapC family toxin, partial [Chloroflexi bacterium]
MVSPSASTGPVYVDSSVLVALLATDDRHHQLIRRWAGRAGSPLLTSVLAEVEVGRSLERRGAHTPLRATFRRILSRLDLVDVTAAIRAAAI